MNTARERARDRLQAWREEQEARHGKRGFSLTALRQKVTGWDGSKMTRLFKGGPATEELDDVETMTGLSMHYLIGKPTDAAQDVPLNATERQLLAWYRAASPDLQQAVQTILQAGALSGTASGSEADTEAATGRARLHQASVSILSAHEGRKRRPAR